MYTICEVHIFNKGSEAFRTVPLVQRSLPSQEEQTHFVFDFISVGAGTAGSLIAHRLATETNFTFVLLEAGGDSHSFYEIPVLGPLLHGTVYDWQYETTPQAHACYAMIDRVSKNYTQLPTFYGNHIAN